MRYVKRVSFVNWIAIGLASSVLAAATSASAHGPTVDITPTGFKPLLLNLFEGTTVHFTNSVAAPEGLVVSDEAKTFASPPIEPDGDGWHYTFKMIGTYEIRIAQRSEAKMRIVVVKKPAP